MNIAQIEAYLEESSELESFLDHYNDTFERITEIENFLKVKDHFINIADKGCLIEELTAIYSSLNVVVEMIEAHKINLENSYFHDEWIKLENAGKKPVQGALEKEASLYVGSYRRLRNIFLGKRDGVDKMISGLQSSLKAMEKERLM